MGDVPFDETRVTFDEWPAMKPSMPLGSLPMATIDGTSVVQTMALVRYIGRQSELYPTDAWEALMVDQVVETVTDFFSGIFSYKGDCKKQLRAMREKHVLEGGERYWGGCEKIIESYGRSGPYVMGEQVTIADIAITGIYILLKIQFLEFLPADALDGYATMKKISETVLALPKVQEYYKKYPIVSVSA